MAMRIKRAFSLLEVMVGMALLVIASGSIAWKMQGAIAAKRFRSDLERLHARLLVCQRLSCAQLADWEGVFKWEGSKLVFEASCEEGQKFSPLKLDLATTFNGKRFDEMTINFFSTGQVVPTGLFVFSRKEERAEWNLPDIFQREEGEGKQ